MENLMSLEDNDMCYACGGKNEKGLHLEFLFFKQENIIETTFVPASYHQGWKGVVHGGIIATVMDEAMAKLVHFLGYHALTASLDIRFKDVAKTLEPLKVRAEVTRFTKKLIFAKAIANREGGQVIAEANSKLMIY
ncbi:MAG: PaaI family thioesterase [Deltaproteobacteria bacterium]|nr:PaaI family thioesterase [Deltaproteobacteria bacterium]